MCSFPFVKFCLFPLALIAPVAKDIQKFYNVHFPDLFPGLPGGFAYYINVVNPPPAVSEATSLCVCRISSVCLAVLSFFGIFFRSRRE